MKAPELKSNIPRYELEALARCLLPDIQAFFESEEGQREFAEWQESRKQTQLNNENSKMNNSIDINGTKPPSA